MQHDFKLHWLSSMIRVLSSSNFKDKGFAGSKIHVSPLYSRLLVPFDGLSLWNVPEQKELLKL
jgi:hypothetical protein